MFLTSSLIMRHSPTESIPCVLNRQTTEIFSLKHESSHKKTDNACTSTEMRLLVVYIDDLAHIQAHSCKQHAHQY